MRPQLIDMTSKEPKYMFKLKKIEADWKNNKGSKRRRRRRNKKKYNNKLPKMPQKDTEKSDILKNE